MRPAAQLLMIEADAIRPVLESLDPSQFDEPTVLTGWSVRDVIAHCGAALSMVAAEDMHGFSPAENEADVESRRGQPLAVVLDELFAGYSSAAARIDLADGRLDGIGLGEWIHGGDVREAVGAPRPYTSEGVELAFDLLFERSRSIPGTPVLEALVDGQSHRFGDTGETVGSLTTDIETFVRLCGGRRPDSDRYQLSGVPASDLALFH
ncbi:MAG: maleylpyruvate isomerase family mycothiol-dependent enzyme [Acidimicrobiia bacterium]|nr:MAG: maleylpyruvate isomerase family mycothiol-dependent enzyme [Acidimicrobiia bacterium]